MKTLSKPGPQPAFEFTERPESECGPNEVKIHVFTAGICGTDLHIQAYDAAAQAMVDAPMIPDHEFYGEVVKVGELVCHVQAGPRASGESHVVRGMCRNCRAGRRQMCGNTVSVGAQRDGAFAEYVGLPEANVWVRRGEHITAELGTLFGPLGKDEPVLVEWATSAGPATTAPPRPGRKLWKVYGCAPVDPAVVRARAWAVRFGLVSLISDGRDESGVQDPRGGIGMTSAPTG